MHDIINQQLRRRRLVYTSVVSALLVFIVVVIVATVVPICLLTSSCERKLTLQEQQEQLTQGLASDPTPSTGLIGSAGPGTSAYSAGSPLMGGGPIRLPTSGATATTSLLTQNATAFTLQLNSMDPETRSQAASNLVWTLGPQNSETVREQAAAFLSGYAFPFPGYDPDDGIKAIINAGVVPALMELLGPQISSTALKEEAALALDNLAFRNYTRDSIFAAGAVIPLVASLAPENSVPLLFYATDTLQFLASKSSLSNKIKIKDAGAIPLLVALLSSSLWGPYWGMIAGMRASAARALMYLAIGYPSAADQIRSSGAVAALSQLVQYAADTRVVEAASNALNVIIG